MKCVANRSRVDLMHEAGRDTSVPLTLYSPLWEVIIRLVPREITLRLDPSLLVYARRPGLVALPFPQPVSDVQHASAIEDVRRRLHTVPAEDPPVRVAREMRAPDAAAARLRVCGHHASAAGATPEARFPRLARDGERVELRLGERGRGSLGQSFISGGRSSFGGVRPREGIFGEMDRVDERAAWYRDRTQHEWN